MMKSSSWNIATGRFGFGVGKFPRKKKLTFARKGAACRILKTTFKLISVRRNVNG